MYELVYCDDLQEYKELQEVVKNRFPNAHLEDASDDAHEHRFSIEIEDTSELRADFFRFAIRRGFFLQCLGGQQFLRDEPSQVKQWMNYLTTSS